MNILSVMYCEILKIVRSKVFAFVFLFFGMAPVMMGLLGRQTPGEWQNNWASYWEGVYNTVTGVGLIFFSFIAAWVFGREFSDKTNKDLVAKPISRPCVVTSKFIVIFIWSLLFSLYIFLLSLITGLVLGLAEFDSALAMNAFFKISTIYLMYIIVATPSALVANMSRGYLASIGFIFAIIIAINALGNTIFVHYFPWSIPALFLKTGTLSLSGVIIMLGTGIAGVTGTFAWWRYAEQN